MSSRLRRLIIVIGILVGVWILGKIWVTIYPDWLWFSALGYIAVYKKILFTMILVWVFLSAFFLVVSLSNLYLIKKLAPQKFSSRVIDAIPAGEIDFDLRKYLYIVLAVLIGGLCILMGYTATDKWEIFLRYFSSVNFGTNDPLFNNDVGFYVFKMPFLKSLYGWSFGVFLLATFLTIVLYFFHGAIVSDRNQFEPPRGVKAHLFSLIAITLLLKAWGYIFTMYNLLYASGASRAVKYGAGWADAHARLPMLWIMLVLCIITAVVFFFSIFMRRIRYALAFFALLFIVGFIGRMYPGIRQQFTVRPNEQDYERKYIEHNVNYTRKAYNLDAIETRLYDADAELNLDSVKQNVPVMENIRLWDWRPLRRIYRAVEEPRPVYEYVDVDIDRYMINGRSKQVMLAARELNYDKLAREGQSWFRRTFIYTHGYGLSMSPVKEIVDGNPQMYIEKIPLRYAPELRSAPEFQEYKYELSEDQTEPGPRIYYGERTNYYVIVNTNDTTPREFDYPTGDAEEKYNSYKGAGGVPISSFWRKVAYAWKFKSYNVFLSKDIKQGSKILYNRTIKDRVKLVAPFLKYDNDPYVVVHDGRLFWIIDAYTSTHLYPYSEPMEDIYRRDVTAARGRGVGGRVLRREIPWGNYIRNSVKVVVDAYNGKIDFYIMDNEGYPIANCYRKIFGGLFKNFKDMPAGLRKHIRYPLAMFWIQALKYEYYHMKDVITFYNETDLWKVGTEVYDNTDRPRAETEVITEPISRFGQTATQRRTTVQQSNNVQPVEPYYVILNLPGKQEAEFLLILPFSPANKAMIMSAWLAAECDEADYGKLILYQFAKEAESIPSPMRIEEYISRRADISEKLSLWDQRGSRVLRGNLLVIPMNNSLLYVEPIYIQSEQQDAIPKLERVIIGYKDDVVMGVNLDDALMMMFGEGAQAALPPETTTFEEVSELPTSTAPTTTVMDASTQTLAKQARRQYNQAQAAQRAGKWSEYGARIKELEQTLKLLEEQAANSP